MTNEELKQLLKPIIMEVKKEILKEDNPINIIAKYNPELGGAYKRYVLAITHLQATARKTIGEDASDQIYEFTTDAASDIRNYLFRQIKNKKKI